MDMLTVVVLALAAVYVYLRLRRTFRRNRSDRSEDIQRKLKELRKKRDEE
ncbi:hypothetical protein [Paenibacillus contaminans]|nr:hypothetical protein [Paenibacillus contaminans]